MMTSPVAGRTASSAEGSQDVRLVPLERQLNIELKVFNCKPRAATE